MHQLHICDSTLINHKMGCFSTNSMTFYPDLLDKKEFSKFQTPESRLQG